MSANDFGEFLNARRLSVDGLSASKLADMLSCSASFIRGIERGIQKPSQEMARRILTQIDVEYKEVDPYTIELSDGTIFKFRASVRGRNKPQTIMPKDEKVIAALQIRVSALEARLNILEGQS